MNTKNVEISMQNKLRKLSVEQIQIAIDCIIEPIAAKKRAWNGTADDLKNYYIATESVSATAIAVTTVSKHIFKFYLIVKELINKVIEKIKSFLHRFKNFDQIKDPDARLTNELLRAVGKKLPTYNQFKMMDAEEVKKMYVPEIKKFLISKKLDTPNTLVDIISVKIYIIISNLYTTLSARLIAGIGDNSLFSAKLLGLALMIKAQKEVSAIAHALLLLAPRSAKVNFDSNTLRKLTSYEIVDMLLLSYSDPVPKSAKSQDLYESTLNIIQTGKTYDLFRRTYDSVKEFEKSDKLELAMRTLKESNVEWINSDELIKILCVVLANIIPKYLIAYSNTITFSEAYFSISNLLVKAKKEENRDTNNVKLIGANYA